MCVSDRLLFSVSGQIGTLQATQMSHEATIKDLQQEQSRLREKIVQLEEEKDRLQSQSQALDEQQRLQILNLEKVGHFVLPVLALFIDVTRFITTGALIHPQLYF